MELNRLQEFVLIAQKKSVKKAAEELNLSPAALSARLKQFESSLNMVLFERNHSEMVLSEKGKQLYPDALRITSQYQGLVNELKRAEETSFHTFRIAIVGTGLPFYLGPFLDTLNARHPHVALDLLDDTFCSVQNGLLSGRVDIYFATMLNRITMPEIARRTIAPSQQFALLPASHRLASRERISITELSGEQFILYPETEEPCIREFQLENLRASGIRYSIYETISSPVFFQLLVPIGKGIIISPVPAMNTLPNCVRIPLTDIAYSASSSLFYSKTNTKPEVKLFVEEYMNFMKEKERHDHGKSL